MKTRFDRRAFLRGIGAGSALLPLLDGELARAAAGKAPVRLLVVVKSNGSIARTDTKMGITQEFFPTPASGTSLTGVPFPAVTAPLEPFADALIFPQYLHLAQHNETKRAGDFNHHNWGMLLTGKDAINDQTAGGHASGPSIDHFIAESLAPPTPIRNLTLGVKAGGTGDGRTAVSWRGPMLANVPESNPINVFDRLFAGRMTGTMPVDTSAMDKLRAEKRSLLDFLGGDLERFRKNLGTTQRVQVDAHLASLREIERELAFNPGVPAAGCVPPARPTTVPWMDFRQFDKTFKAQLDLVASAFACDATRVATIALADAGAGNLVFEWLGKDFLGPRLTDNAGGSADVTNYHDITHAVGRSGGTTLGKADLVSLGRKRAVEKWHMEQLAYFLGQLKARPDVDGKTLLDNTVVLWADALGQGWFHVKNDLPWVVAGKGGGYLKAGNVFKLGGEAAGTKVPTNGVLVEIARAMGVAVEDFGDYRGGFPQLRA